MATVRILFSIILMTTAVFYSSAFRFCNEDICAVKVSKCLLTEHCICDTTNPMCCKNCGECLGKLYGDCCSCLELCTNVCPENKKLLPSDQQTAQIGELDGIPGLFSLLTESEDSRWTRITLPAGKLKPISLYTRGHYIDEQNELQRRLDFNLIEDEFDQSCTTIFVDACVSKEKCIHFCGSMGASGYRWRYEGCCQCFGHQCSKGGIDENHCRNCQPNHFEDEDLEEFENYDDEDLLDYGEDY